MGERCGLGKVGDRKRGRGIAVYLASFYNTTYVVQGVQPMS